MVENSFIKPIETAIRRFLIVFRQKSRHLRQELVNDPKGGVFWWLKTHHQKLAFDQALEELQQEARKPDFQLDAVNKKLSGFILKKDDAGQAQWYQDAHNQLIDCQQKLDAASELKINLIRPALTELKYISAADQFHKKLKLQALQQRVQNMYDAIIERLDVLQKDTMKKQHEHKTDLDVRDQEAKTQLAVELTLQHEAQLKQERAALKKVELEQELLDKQREAEEAAWKREAEDRQLRLQETQQQHQLDLQKTFSDLHLDGDETNSNASTDSNNTSEITGEQHIEALLDQIHKNKLDRTDPVVKEKLQSLLAAIAGLE